MQQCIGSQKKLIASRARLTLPQAQVFLEMIGTPFEGCDFKEINQMSQNLNYKKELFFPIGSKSREFVLRSLIGVVLADNGYKVYIGNEKLVTTIVLSKPQKGGIYFYKGTRQKPDTPDRHCCRTHA